MSDKDQDNPFGPPSSEDPFGRKPDEPSLEDIWARADRKNAPPPPSAYGPPPSPAHGSPPPNEVWRRDPAMPHDPFAAPQPNGPPRRADGSIPALVLGILGLVLCPLCAPFAWALGRKAELDVDASGGMLTGRGEATAGKILGIVTCVLYGLLIAIFVVIMGVGLSAGP